MGEVLEKNLVSYGVENPVSLMDKFYRVGNDMLLTLRNYVTNPAAKKQPRYWGSLDAAKMINVSNPTFRKLLEIHSTVPGTVLEKNKKGREVKKFTLEAINFLRDKAKTRYKRPKGSECLIVAVSNLKGGVGKTQTAVDLCKKISLDGLRVLLIDFDAQGTATLISSGLIPDLELSYEDTITTYLIDNPNGITKIIQDTSFHGFDIIPANLAIQDCDLILPNENLNNNDKIGSPFMRLKKALSPIKENYDVIIIDCGPNLGALTINAIVACNGIIIPIPPVMSDYSSFIMFTSTLKSLFKELGNKKLEYLRLLLSKHPGHGESLEMENMMREQFGRYILANHMCETIEVAKAASEIGTIYDIVKPRGSREAYRRAIQHLDDVNNEIISGFKYIWEEQGKESKING